MCRAIKDGGFRCDSRKAIYAEMTPEERAEHLRRREQQKRTEIVTVRLTEKEKGGRTPTELRGHVLRPAHLNTARTLNEVLTESEEKVDKHHAEEYAIRKENEQVGSGRYSANGYDSTTESNTSFRVTAAEKHAIEVEANLYGLTPTEFVRRQITKEDMRELSPFVAESKNDARKTFLQIPEPERLLIVQQGLQFNKTMDEAEADLKEMDKAVEKATDPTHKANLEAIREAVKQKREQQLEQASQWVKSISKRALITTLKYTTTDDEIRAFNALFLSIGATRRMFSMVSEYRAQKEIEKQIKASTDTEPEAEKQVA